MKTKTFSGKYNVVYDPENNDSIVRVDRHGEAWSGSVPIPHGVTMGMWYHILELEQTLRTADAAFERMGFGPKSIAREEIAKVLD